MITVTLIAAVSCWSSIVAATAKHGSYITREDHVDVEDGPRRYHCRTGSSSSAEDAANPEEIPLNVMMQLNQVANASELFTNYMPDTDMAEAISDFTEVGFRSRSAALLPETARVAYTPKQAKCAIEIQTIRLDGNEDRSLFYYPTCTRVKRCGGCCGHDLLACRPTKIETLDLQVIVLQYNSAGKFEFKSMETVSIDQHLKCECGCQIKEEDCSALQTYEDCHCKCTNVDEEDKCHEEHDLKQWDSATCTCECREIKECTSGFVFDRYTCRCEGIRRRLKNSSTKLNRNQFSLAIL